MKISYLPSSPGFENCIAFNSKDIYFLVCKYALSLGFTWPISGIDDNDLLRQGEIGDYNILYFDLSGKKIMHDLVYRHCYSKYFCENIHELHSYLTGKKKLSDLKPITIKVELNNEITAEVSKEGIKVGCQNFDLSIVPALMEVVKKVQNAT